MKALVLCAGFGTRLGDLTREIPKPMLPIGPHPLLAYLLGHLRSHGFLDIAINLHFQPHIIRNTFGDGSRWGLRLHYVEEPTLLGTAGALRNLTPFFANEPAFVVQYGDILTDHNLSHLVQSHRQHHQQHHALATLLVHPRPNSNSVLDLDPHGRITRFLERPSPETRASLHSHWVNSGLCVASPELLHHLPQSTPADLPRDTFVPLTPSGRLFASPLQGFRCAIDSPDRLHQARSAVAQNLCHIQPLDVPNPSPHAPTPHHPA